MITVGWASTARSAAPRVTACHRHCSTCRAATTLLTDLAGRLDVPGIWPRICRDAVPRPPLHLHDSSRATSAHGDEPVLCLRSLSCCAPPRASHTFGPSCPRFAPVGRWSTRAVEASKFALSAMQEAQVYCVACSWRPPCNRFSSVICRARRTSAPRGASRRPESMRVAGRAWRDAYVTKHAALDRAAWLECSVANGGSDLWCGTDGFAAAFRGRRAQAWGCSRGSTRMPRIPQCLDPQASAGSARAVQGLQDVPSCASGRVRSTS